MARTTELEILDTSVESTPVDELRTNLRDIRRANRFLGGTRAVLRAITPYVARVSGCEAPVAVLDVATGSADIPVALVRYAERRGWRMRVTATDVQPDILAIASAAKRHGVTVERADALALPYGDGSFHISVLSLALHHFDPDDAVQALVEMRRVSRVAMVVNDFERCRMGFVGAWLFSRATTRNRLTRNDAPLSVRRSYTLPEVAALARAAGWQEIRVRREIPFRYVLTGTP